RLRRAVVRGLPRGRPAAGPGGDPVARHRLGTGRRGTHPLRGLFGRLAQGRDPVRARAAGLCDRPRGPAPARLRRRVRAPGLRDHRRSRHPRRGVFAGGRAGSGRRPAVALRPCRDRAGGGLVPHGPRNLQRPAREGDRSRADHYGGDRDGHGRARPLAGSAQDGGDPVSATDTFRQAGRPEPRRAHTHELYGAGAWTRSSAAARLPLVDPATGCEWGSVPDCSADDVDVALAAADRAFRTGPWPESTPSERAALLRRIADEVEARATEMASTNTLE